MQHHGNGPMPPGMMPPNRMGGPPNSMGAPGMPPPHMQPNPHGGMMSPHGQPPPPNMMMGGPPPPPHPSQMHPHHPHGMPPPPPGSMMMGPPPPGAKLYPPNQPMIANPQNPNAPPIYPCGLCHREVQGDSDEAIMCESGCNFWFHRTCVGLIPEAYYFLKNEIYAEWVCDSCVQMKRIAPIKFKA
jgi:hypothetical protein